MVALSKNTKWQYTLGRVLLFCISSAIVLATASRLTQGMANEFSQHVFIIIAAAVTFGLTVLFVAWEGLRLNDVGVVPGPHTIPRLFIGFLIGIFLALLQPALVLLSGHLKLVVNLKMTAGYIVSNLLLYLFIACREELAFRGYPLRSLNYVMSSWKAQLIIAAIFSVEHVIGGMTWIQAFLGVGVGAILFGMAA